MSSYENNHILDKLISSNEINNQTNEVYSGSLNELKIISINDEEDYDNYNLIINDEAISENKTSINNNLDYKCEIKKTNETENSNSLLNQLKNDNLSPNNDYLISPYKSKKTNKNYSIYLKKYSVILLSFTTADLVMHLLKFNYKNIFFFSSDFFIYIYAFCFFCYSNQKKFLLGKCIIYFGAILWLICSLSRIIGIFFLLDEDYYYVTYFRIEIALTSIISFSVFFSISVVSNANYE